MKIVLCLPGREFSDHFLKSFFATIEYCKDMHYQVVLRNEYSSNVYFARARCLACDTRLGRNQPPFQGIIKDYDQIVWIDSDISWTVDDFKKLISSRYSIYSGTYLMENGVEFPVVEDWNVETFKKHGTFHFMNVDDMSRKPGPFKCVYNGMGFMTMKRGVFEKVEYPWFAPKFTEIGKIYDFCSEDVGFCLSAAEKGFDVMVDPRLIVGHLKSRVLNIPKPEPAGARPVNVWSSVTGMK